VGHHLIDALGRSADLDGLFNRIAHEPQRRHASAALAPGALGPAPVQRGAGVEVGEERLEAGELGPHVVPEAIVDLDRLGHELLLAPWGAPAAELGAQGVQAVLGRDDGADLVEVEADQLLQLTNAAYP